MHISIYAYYSRSAAATEASAQKEIDRNHRMSKVEVETLLADNDQDMLVNDVTKEDVRNRTESTHAKMDLDLDKNDTKPDDRKESKMDDVCEHQSYDQQSMTSFMNSPHHSTSKSGRDAQKTGFTVYLI